MHQSDFIDGLLDYLNISPTPFHAAINGADLLRENRFEQLFESEDWGELDQGKYFILRNDSSLLAFTLKEKPSASMTLRLAGAHTDSPCLKVKPNPVRCKHGYIQLSAEVYGGALLGPWFDRDLSLAGRVCWQRDNGQLYSSLIDFKDPIANIPSLAIHLDRDANSNKNINKQTDIVPVIMLMDNDEKVNFSSLLYEQISQSNGPHDASAILDADLFFYDTQPAGRLGYNKEFITGARIDNLLSCYCLLRGLTAPDPQENSLIILNDHEEVGSLSTVGAQGPFLQDILERLFPTPKMKSQVLSRSFFVSADNAHAVHPNFPAKHDDQHLPLINKGPVIKINANQRYATNGLTSALFKKFCLKAEIPVQEFVMRNDMACGSTIGPLTAGEIGVPTVDVGVPSLAMHSIRETAGIDDCWYLYQVLQTFFKEEKQSLLCKTLV